MSKINIKKEVNLTVDEAVDQITTKLKDLGFGILTRIDFHCKMKEKLNKDLDPVVILGACNPAMAFEAYSRNTDVTSLMPCNVVVRQLGPKKVSIEMIRLSTMMGSLNNPELVKMAEPMDVQIQKMFETLG